MLDLLHQRCVIVILRCPSQIWMVLYEVHSLHLQCLCFAMHLSKKRLKSFSYRSEALKAFQCLKIIKCSAVFLDIVLESIFFNASNIFLCPVTILWFSAILGCHILGVIQLVVQIPSRVGPLLQSDGDFHHSSLIGARNKFYNGRIMRAVSMRLNDYKEQLLS